ncbi:hypothetical protein KFK09_020630 [Dendrobium nobile]|uniref:Uncharacterized protein n=1 Tax=Dendrobium nobile TaxID=94219 RepID=A0A8T3ALH0_DENNO|nr:hypothetical protein KFK09_020630 [Dendrobium nobile]
MVKELLRALVKEGSYEPMVKESSYELMIVGPNATTQCFMRLDLDIFLPEANSIEAYTYLAFWFQDEGTRIFSLY